MRFLDRVDWSHFPEEHGYRNCQKITLGLESTPEVTLRYAEGYFGMGWGIGIDHAWLTLNGKVVDPSIRLMGHSGPLLGTFPEELEYFGVDAPRRVLSHSQARHPRPADRRLGVPLAHPAKGGGGRRGLMVHTHTEV